MDKKRSAPSVTSAPWSDTPATSQRIVSAISRIAAVLRAGAWQFATTQGINPTQVEILEMLLSRTQGVRLSWIAEQLGVTSASASDSIASLTEKGLVEKARAIDDGRAVTLRLTRSGKTVAKKIEEAMGFASSAVDRLPESTQHDLFKSLLVLIGEFQKAEQFPDIRACVTCEHFAANVRTGDATPHQCLLVNAPLSISLLRLDCPEHTPASTAAVTKNRQILKAA